MPILINNELFCLDYKSNSKYKELLEVVTRGIPI